MRPSIDINLGLLLIAGVVLFLILVTGYANGETSDMRIQSIDRDPILADVDMERTICCMVENSGETESESRGEVWIHISVRNHSGSHQNVQNPSKKL